MEYSLTQVATISFSKNILLWVSNFRYYSRKLILFLSLWQKKECNINLQEYSFIVSYWTSENLFTFGIYMWKYSTGLLTACEQDQDGTSWSCSQARTHLFKLEAMTYKRWSFTESMVISPTLTALMSCLSSSLAAPEVPFCLSSSVLLTLLPSETRSNRATIWKCSDKTAIIQYIHHALMST